jgi:hypothetical protein
MQALHAKFQGFDCHRPEERLSAAQTGEIL